MRRSLDLFHFGFVRHWAPPKTTVSIVKIDDAKIFIHDSEINIVFSIVLNLPKILDWL